VPDPDKPGEEDETTTFFPPDGRGSPSPVGSGNGGKGNVPSRGLEDTQPVSRKVSDGDETTLIPERDVAAAALSEPGGLIVSPVRYRIVRPHAEGGLGAVFVAHDEELHREVALKEILERHAHDAHHRERFVLEAEVTGGLEHPGIVPVYGL